ncbi:zinc finger protein 830 [Neodiprion pinetum]|uniref:zinc finger protein 830 n=1 Tax=Neodiprion pinetum TaxID=441929 RepID=UPI001EDD9110|nr:zinc finger protein 830 [Neodiprion pinetum]
MSLRNVGKKVTQTDLRRVMNEHKKKLTTVTRIESPIAKYTDSGQLICILCKTLVRSEAVWNIHLNSKIHKENIILAKKEHVEPPKPAPLAPHSFKRPTSTANVEVPSKKLKSILKNGPAVSSALPDDFFDKTSAPKPPRNVHEAKTEVTKESAESEDVEMEEKEEEKDLSQAQLPEGFFDDPIMDAKVRNVEYKDPIEEEWEKFQKEIKEEAAQSAQIIADDQEEATTERQLDEIEEQMRHWSRVLELERRREEVLEQVERKSVAVEEEVSSGDEAEFDEFLDWRAKKSYK